MGNIIAIGDIHGCLRPLENLLDKIPINWEADYLVFLGDYIDRGPDSRLVLDTLISLKDTYGERIICLLGNHEWMFLRYLQGHDQYLYLLNGGDVTLAQFSKDDIVRVPHEYICFLESLLPYWETEDYIFVHAGLRPGVSLERQRLEDLLWIRAEFIYSEYEWGKLVVFAHTPVAKPLILPNKIGIDTGCVYGGELTALVLPKLDFYHTICGR